MQNKPNQIVLECLTDCDPIVTISNFLKTEHVFSNQSVPIIVKDNGVNIFETTYVDYLDYYWIPNNGYPVLKNTSLLKNITLNDDFASIDNALDCRYDPDYSCDDWKNSPLFGDMVAEISSIINTSEIRIEVNQRWIDGNNTARRKIIAYATAIPIGRIAAFLSTFTQITIQELIIESMVATEINDLLTGTNWYRIDLKSGDVLVFKSGELTIIRKDGTTEKINAGTGGNNSGGGSGSIGDNSGPGGSGNGGWGSGSICKTHGRVCTGGGCTHWVDVHPCSNRP